MSFCGRAGAPSVLADTVPAGNFGAPLVELHFPAGVLTLEQKSAMIQGVTDVLLNRALSLLGIALFFSWIAWTLLDNVRKGRYKDGPAYEAVRQYVALHSSS